MNSKEAEEVKKFAMYWIAIAKAFDEKRIYEGTVEFVCPICGGKAIAKRLNRNVNGISDNEDYCTRCKYSLQYI